MFLLATVAVSVITSFLASMLNEGSKYYISDTWNYDKHLVRLRATLDAELNELTKTLQSVGVRPIHTNLPSDWLDELEQFRYDLEDIQESKDSASSKKELVTKFLKTSITRVKRMREWLGKIEGDMASLGQCCGGALPYELPAADEFLRVEVKKKIIEELTMDQNSSPGISIIGIGGTGKSVLANAITLEARIKSHFPCILFPPPQSPKFDSKNVLDYIRGSGPPSKDQRVLILLDGVNSVDPEGWSQFRSQCQEILKQKPKFLITTQNPRVADVTATCKHRLESLSDEECFLLIEKLATKGDLSEADVHHIDHNKKELADTCRGLPLLANQIGILLSAAGNGHRLDTIRYITSNSWKVPGLARVLVNLKPVSLLVQKPHLNRCLTYCSLFPQDYEFKEDNLVQFWMAEGFTHFSSTTSDASCLDHATREYFEDLLSCSIFQTSKAPPGEEPSYKMHEFAYDLAQQVASNIFCRKHMGKSISVPSFNEISNITRHFSLGCEYIGDNTNDVVKILNDIETTCSRLRTFLLVYDAGKKISKNPTFFQSLTLLRVLDLSYTNLVKLEAKHISKLTYLRYLDLSHTPVEKLPRLSKNYALQVLKLQYCKKLLHLPTDLSKLTNLIFLEVNISCLGSIPRNIGQMRNLQRLNVFIVGNEEGLRIAELKNLNGLRKSLHIAKLENVKTKEEAQKAELHNKGMLERLELQWTSLSDQKTLKKGTRSSSKPVEDPRHVLEGLKPHKNLKELIMRNYYGSEFPQWLSKTEVCGILEYIHLDRCEVIPSLDQLPWLKTLRIEAMDEIISKLDLKQIFVKNGKFGQLQGFPYIKTLVLCDMLKLDEWIQLATSYMPRLCDILVDKCQDLEKLPPLDRLMTLHKLKISWCTSLKELPALPASLEILIIKHSDILKHRCQVGKADWQKVIGIKIVEIDSKLVDTSVQVQGIAKGNQQASPYIRSIVTN